MAGRFDNVCRVPAHLLADSIPGATLEWIEAAGHMAPIENPGPFTAIAIVSGALKQFAKKRDNEPLLLLRLDVRFGSEANIQPCLGDVRLPPIADIGTQSWNVRFVP